MSVKNSQPDSESLAKRRAQLEAILAELEAGNVPLEQVTDRLKEAAQLAESIERDLRDHKASIQVLKERFDTKG